MKTKKYSFLINNKVSLGKYSLVVLRKKDIQNIRKWRNDQINVLRQKIPLSKETQINYFSRIIEKSFYKKKPDLILFSFLYDGKCIGYGGLVHIDWNSNKGEVSFINDTSRTKSKIVYQKDFSVFLKLLFKIAFNDLNLNKLTTETFDIRDWTINCLENMGFKREGRLKKHVLIDSKFCDSILHAKFLKNNS